MMARLSEMISVSKAHHLPSTLALWMEKVPSYYTTWEDNDGTQNDRGYTGGQ